MENNKKGIELKSEDLTKVAGGATNCDNKSFSGHTGQHDAVVGNYYFCVNDGTNNWFAGTCIDTWEKSYALFFSKRTHTINVINKGSCSWVTEGNEKDIRGEDWSLFTYMNGKTVQQCVASGVWK